MDQALLALMKQLSAEEKLMFQSDYEDQKKSTVLAVVLALLLGGFGAHWFYLGRTGRALTYLLLNILGGVLTVLLIGYVLLAAVWIACLIDAVFMGGTISAMNRRIGQRIFEALLPCVLISCRGKPHERQNLCDRLGGVFGGLHGC